MAENQCFICGNNLTTGIFGGTYGGKCRICNRYFCNNHIHDGICGLCKEKMGGKR